MILDARGIAWIYDNLPPEYKMKLTKESLDRMKDIMRDDPPLTPMDCDVLIAHAEATIGLEELDSGLPRQWVHCPICGESDMRKTDHGDDNFTIFCTNHACGSNGGDNFSMVPVPHELIDLQSRFDELKVKYDLLDATAEGLKLEVKTYRKFSTFSPKRSDRNEDGPSRAEIAAQIMAATYCSQEFIGQTAEKCALFSVQGADALIEALKK